MPHAIVDVETVEASHGVFKPLRAALGVTAFGINQLELAPGAEGFEHDHSKDGQEEVYAIIGGSGTIHVDGVAEEISAGKFVFLSPDTKRKMDAGPDGLKWIAISLTRRLSRLPTRR